MGRIQLLRDLYSSVDHPSIRNSVIPPFYIQGQAKVGLQLRVLETQSLFLCYYCFIYHMNSYKPTFGHPCIL